MRFADLVGPRPGRPLDPGWEVVALPLPPGATRPYIDVIRGTAPDDVWVLCTVRTAAGEVRLAFHDRGAGFVRDDELPAAARTTIYPISRTDVWAAGRNGWLAHFDGARWIAHQFVGFPHDFVDAFARPADVWLAAAGPRVVHFDGISFEIVAPPELAGSTTHELWGTATEVLVPVNVANRPTSLARFDGVRWTLDALGEGGATLIHGSGPADVWVLGRRGGGWRWGGAGYQRHATAEGPLWSLYVASPERAYAVGERGAVVTWDGARWQPAAINDDRLVAVYAPPGGRVLVGGRQLYRARAGTRDQSS